MQNIVKRAFRIERNHLLLDIFLLRGRDPYRDVIPFGAGVIRKNTGKLKIVYVINYIPVGYW